MVTRAVSGAAKAARSRSGSGCCRRCDVRLSHASHDRPPAHGGTLRGDLRRTRRAVTSRRRSPSSRGGSSAGEHRHGAARRHRHRQVGDDGLAHRAGAAADPRDGAQQDAGRAARQRVPRAAARTTPSSTSSATTTTTSPRPTSRRPTPTSRRTRSVNDEVERLRHAATNVAADAGATSSSSPRCRCIYGLGTPAGVRRPDGPACRSAQEVDRDDLLRRFVEMQYTRNDLDFTRGTFRVRGDTVEIIPVYEELADPHRVLRRRDRARLRAAPAHRRGRQRGAGDVRLPGLALRRRSAERMERAIGSDRGRAARPARRASSEQGKLLEAQRLRDAHDLRHRDDAAGRLLHRHRELLAPHRRPRRRARRPTRLLDYFPEDFLLVIDESHVTVPQIGGDVRGRHVAASARSSSTASGCRAPSTTGRCKWEEFLERDRPDRLPLGDARATTSWPSRGGVGRADHPPDRPDRPRDRRSSRPRARSTTCSTRSGAHRAQRARPGHDADQEDGRGPHRLPARARASGSATCTRDVDTLRRVELLRELRTGRVRRARRHQPAARGARPARGVARVDPRRRQGGLPALGTLAHPDHRPRGPQRVRPGAHVRRQGHRLDAAGHRRDQPPPREAGRLQHRARHRPARRCARRSPTSPTCSSARTPTPRS